VECGMHVVHFWGGLECEQYDNNYEIFPGKSIAITVC
jgi:hypothetical protein